MANSLSLLGAGKSGASAAAAGGYDEPAVTSGLVVKLDVADPDSFDSGSSTVWTNTVDDVDGTFTNGPAYDDGSGSDDIPLIYFDGSDDYFDLVRDNSAMDEGFTLAAFAKPHAIGTSSSGNLGYWWSFGFLDPVGGWSSVYGETNKLFSTGHGSSGTDQFADGDSFVMDEWHHVVWRNDNAGNMDSWINGVKATSSHDGYNVDDAPADNIYLAQLGNNCCTGWFLEVSLAQYLVYDRPLSDSEVTSLWDGDKGRFSLS